MADIISSNCASGVSITGHDIAAPAQHTMMQGTCPWNAFLTLIIRSSTCDNTVTSVINDLWLTPAKVNMMIYELNNAYVRDKTHNLDVLQFIHRSMQIRKMLSMNIRTFSYVLTEAL